VRVLGVAMATVLLCAVGIVVLSAVVASWLLILGGVALAVGVVALGGR